MTEHLRRKVERLLDLSGHAPISPSHHQQSRKDADEIIAALRQADGVRDLVLPEAQSDMTKALLARGIEAQRGETTEELARSEARQRGGEAETPKGGPGVWKVRTRESQMVTLRRDPGGKPTVWCDPEIADLVDALNTDRLSTVASCCGHGFRPANIALKDGREIIIARNHAEARKIDALFPLDINGDAR